MLRRALIVLSVSALPAFSAGVLLVTAAQAQEPPQQVPAPPPQNPAPPPQSTPGPDGGPPLILPQQGRDCERSRPPVVS